MAVTGAELIEAERARQLTDEGFTFDHDACHAPGELALAAAAYALGDVDLWPFEPEAFKPSRCTPMPADEGAAELLLHDLVRSGALIAAEIDRLLRVGR
jgi:hypothetical protein